MFEFFRDIQDVDNYHVATVALIRSILERKMPHTGAHNALENQFEECRMFVVTQLISRYNLTACYINYHVNVLRRMYRFARFMLLNYVFEYVEVLRVRWYDDWVFEPMATCDEPTCRVFDSLLIGYPEPCGEDEYQCGVVVKVRAPRRTSLEDATTIHVDGIHQHQHCPSEHFEVTNTRFYCINFAFFLFGGLTVAAAMHMINGNIDSGKGMSNRVSLDASLRTAKACAELVSFFHLMFGATTVPQILSIQNIFFTYHRLETNPEIQAIYFLVTNSRTQGLKEDILKLATTVATMEIVPHIPCSPILNTLAGWARIFQRLYAS